MKTAVYTPALCVAALCLAACSDERERNIIVDRAPFFAKSFAYDPTKIDVIVFSARKYATDHKMDFLLARQSPAPGDFNATAASHDLNLKVMHSGAIDGQSLIIFAISRKKPSEADVREAQNFACQITASCEASQTDMNSNVRSTHPSVIQRP